MRSNNQKKIFRADTEEKKQLTKSEKRKIMAACAAAAAIAVILLAAGISYSVRYVPKEDTLSFEEMKNSVQKQMQEEMKTASAYLDKLDGSIAENQRKLEEVNSQLAQRQESLLEVETTQKKLTENSSDVTYKVNELDKKTETQIETVRQEMESVHTDILTAMEQISEIIQSLETQKKEESTDHTETMKEISGVNDSVHQVNESVRIVEEKLSQSYESLKGLIKDFRTEEEESRKEMLLQLTEVESSIKQLLESDMAQITDAFTDMTEEFQTRLAALGQALDGRLNRLDENMTGLDNSMGQLGENMSGLNGNMSQLGEHMSGLDTHFTAGIDRLDSDMGNLNGDLKNLGTDLGGKIGDLDARMDNFNSGLDSSMVQIQQTLAKQFGDLNITSGQNTDELRKYMGELNQEIRQDINQVFTSVSNGKKGLASALLTKGVTAAEDATFAQLADAILQIEQKVVIGVQEIPGAISYRYHYHEDASGNNPHEETCQNQGGCYTVPDYHVHSRRAGCYATEKFHEHTKDCPGHPVWVDWDGEGYWGYIYECNDRPLNASREVLVCSKKEGAIDAYLPSCGLLDGQIIGAEIIYDSSAVTSKFSVPEKRAFNNDEAFAEKEQEETAKIPPAPADVAEMMEKQRQEQSLEETEENSVENSAEPENERETERFTEPESETEAESSTEPESGEKTEVSSEPERETVSEIRAEEETKSESGL